MSQHTVVLPGGFKDAKIGILSVSIIGEVLQGGLFFGWNALAVMMTDLNNYDSSCGNTPAGELCKSQESALALLWTVGIFALNCGPVLMGFVLDYLGPKFTSIVGIFLNMLGLILFAVSNTDGTNAFVPAAIILGLGNITFHLAQFHISALFPRQRGLVSSIFVAGFTGSGIIMYLLLLIFQAAGATMGAYRATLLAYAGICALWMPLMLWIMPNDSFRIGMVYLMRPDWKFEIRNRNELDVMFRRATTLQDYVASAEAHQSRQRAGAGAYNASSGHRAVELQPTAGLVNGAVPDSSDPYWAFDGETPRETPTASNGLHQDDDDHSNLVNVPIGGGDEGNNRFDYIKNKSYGQNSPEQRLPTPAIENAEVGPESVPLPPDVSWGPLIFEARRFVELRKKSFKEQFFSSESFWMGVFYTLNVFILQFYLGTMRLQLEYKGDSDNAYSNFGNVVVAFAFLTIPVIGWLLDKKGYAITLGAILSLNVFTSVFQALPVLWLQWITITTWMVARFFMYSSYFAIFGALFGFRNFGKLVAIDNTFNGLFGLIQYPLTYLGIHGLDGDFTWINVAQIVVLLPFYFFCWKMYRWEREDLVPIRPLEGEELPCDMAGPRTRKKLPHLNLPHLHLPSVPHFGLSGSPRAERMPSSP